MKIYKFGGASVKNADAFRNLAQIVKTYGGSNQLLIVVSAMGKTTNALEQVFDLAFHQKDYSEALQQSCQYHLEVVQALFPDPGSPVYEELDHLFSKLNNTLKNLNRQVGYDQLYDQTVSFGELLASVILHQFLQLQGLTNTWIDSRKYIQTDTTWREAKIDWAWTERSIK